MNFFWDLYLGHFQIFLLSRLLSQVEIKVKNNEAVELGKMYFFFKTHIWKEVSANWQGFRQDKASWGSYEQLKHSNDKVHNIFQKLEFLWLKFSIRIESYPYIAVFYPTGLC